jgi:hypothetical protein
MIVSAVLCPSPPLLVSELSGPDPFAAELRDACSTAVTTLIDSSPDLIAVVGPADHTVTWPADAQLDLAAYGGLPRPPVKQPAPLAVGLGAMLLDQAGYDGPRLLQSVAHDEQLPRCLHLATRLHSSAARIGLLVVADGTARRTLKAPGYFDERAALFDAEIERCVSIGDLAALHDLDQTLAQDLMATGWSALQVLAGTLDGRQVNTKVVYAAAPFGVGYLVAVVTPKPGP